MKEQKRIKTGGLIVIEAIAVISIALVLDGFSDVLDKPVILFLASCLLLFEIVLIFILIGTTLTWIKEVFERIKKKTPPPQSQDKKEVVIVEAVAHRTDDGKVEFKHPASVVENTTLSGRELKVREVQKLRYQYKDSLFQRICHREGLTAEEYEIVKQLVFLNSGYLSPPLLQLNLQKGYGICARLCEALIEHHQAVKPVGDPLYSLPPHQTY